jgi:eukaryotic-like serine/threonine-protein kinase
MIGQRLLHYEITAKLGEGGMGVVYKARDTHLDRFVAIKVLPPEMVTHAGRKARFVQEAKAASALNHPNIVVVHDIASDSGVDFIAMEYVVGKTLHQLIPRKGMRVGEALNISVQIAGALARAHADGIIHRDLKPANIMVDGHGQVKILDFGLAKLAERNNSEDDTISANAVKTGEGAIVGTAAYMSPEQAEGKPVDARSDVFSFGAVLYEMVTGQRTFSGDSMLSTLAAVLNNEPAPLPPDLPSELRTLIARCLRKDRDRRFQHIDDVLIALRELKEESDSGKLAVEQAAPSRRPSRVIQWAAGGSALVLAIGAFAAWQWYFRGRPVATPPLPEAVPLTTYPGAEYQPSFSPDGSQVAFTWCQKGRCNIYVKQIGIEQPYPLTSGDHLDYSPEWSPDGARIAFARYWPAAARRVQYIVVPQRGGPEKVLAEFAFSHVHWAFMLSVLRMLSWSPDSRWLVVTHSEGSTNDGLYVIPVGGGETRKLTDPGSVRIFDADPSVSPDGQWLAFTRHASVHAGDLYVLRLSPDLVPQGQPVKLKADRGLKLSPAWNPATGEVLFFAGEFLRGRLLQLNPEAPSTPVQVQIGGYESGPFAISRQGRFAFSRYRFNLHLWRIAATERGAAWTAPEQFASSTRDEMEPAYSPDGARIAFASTRSGRRQIWVCSHDGSDLVQLTETEGQAVRPRWSPDGRRIAFYNIKEGNSDIWVVAASGGSPRRLTDHPDLDMNPEWSCDGKAIYFLSGRDLRVQTWKIAVTGGEPELAFADKSGVVVDPPGCHALYYIRRSQDSISVWRTRAGGGQDLLVAESVHPWTGTEWQVFPDGIYYVGVAEGGGGLLLFRDFATGKVRRIATIDRPYYGLAVSPDRKSIIYTSIGEFEADLMLVENFR